LVTRNLLSALELCRTASHRMLSRFHGPPGTTIEQRGPLGNETVMRFAKTEPTLTEKFLTNCETGVFHTVCTDRPSPSRPETNPEAALRTAIRQAWNMLTADELAQLAPATSGRGPENTSVIDILCAKVYPLPPEYDGPLRGRQCGAGSIGVDEADARLELVRLGACGDET
jgi:hypothetical protein